LPAGGVQRSLGPSSSRVRCPGGVGEATAARRNKSSRTLPRPVGVSLRHQRRVRGGGPPGVEALFRSSLPAAHRPGWEVSLLAFSLKEGGAAWDFVDGGRVEQARLSCGGCCHRRRACFQDLRSSGRVPGRWANSGGIISSIGASVSCGSLQSFGDGASFDPRTAVTASGGGRRRRFLEDSAGTESRGLTVTFLFLKGFCAIWSKQLSSVSCWFVPVFLHVLYSS